MHATLNRLCMLFVVNVSVIKNACTPQLKYNAKYCFGDF